MVLTVSEAITNAFLLGPATSNWSRWPSGCKAAGSRRRSATRPRFPQRSPGEPLRAWAVADRTVGRRVAPCQGPPRNAGHPPPAYPSATSQARRVARWSGRQQRVTATMWLTTRRGDLIDRGSLCRGALANAAHRRLLTRVMPSEVLGDIPQRPNSNSPNSQVGKDDIGQHLWQPDLRPRTDQGEQAVPGKRRHPVGGFQPVTLFGP